MKIKMNWKELGERAIKSFFEGFISSLVANLTVFQDAFVEDGAWQMAAISIGIGAVAAGISAVWNGVFGPLFSLDNNDQLLLEEESEEDTDALPEEKEEQKEEELKEFVVVNVVDER